MFILRKAKEEDLITIQDLAEQTWPTAYGDIISEAQIRFMLDTMYQESELLTQMQKGNTFLIASQLIADIGFAGYSLLDFETQTYKLDKLYVLPKMHGKGVGKFLLNEVIDDVKELGAELLQLNVNRANTAKGFYENAGFKIKKTVDLDIGNGFFMNDYIMEKEL